MRGDLEMRRAVDGDRSKIMDLCRASLGWDPADPDEDFYAWKHDDNSFGASPTWVAVTNEGRIVGLRVFLRWRFVNGGGQRIEAVRAVDTATHPEFQGKGIFSRLTLAAVDELTSEGVDVVFNTPNDKSMPGYLKMGWSSVGAVAAAARFGGPSAIIRTSKSKTAAELWSEETTVGVDATEFFADVEGIERLLASQPRSAQIQTDRSVEFYQWRYGFSPLRYRAFPLGDDSSGGAIVFRVRRRGAAIEVAICDVVTPPGYPAWKLIRAFSKLRRASGADYLLATTRTAGLSKGFVSLPGMGPMLTWRPLARPGVPELDGLDLALGDLELF